MLRFLMGFPFLLVSLSDDFAFAKAKPTEVHATEERYESEMLRAVYAATEPYESETIISRRGFLDNSNKI